MKIYSRSGDKGKTSLFGGCCLDKDDKRVKAIGAIDELNSWLGILQTAVQEKLLEKIQNDLMIIGSFLGGDKEAKLFLLEKTVKEMEVWIDKEWSRLPKLHNFIIPGGTRTAGFIHVVRAVCRRAERKVVEAGTNELIIKYLNRLSDFLFVLARLENKKAGIKEKIWEVKKLAIDKSRVRG